MLRLKGRLSCLLTGWPIHHNASGMATYPDPSKEACSLLKDVWENRGFPVDPVYIAEKLGIKVMGATLPENVSGAYVKKLGNDPQIFVNAKDSNNRRRFTIAHELGHHVSRASRGETSEASIVDLRSDLAGQGTDIEEMFANQFAACLLMPTAAVKLAFEQGMSAASLAGFFAVSEEAMGYRLKSLGLNYKRSSSIFSDTHRELESA